MAFEKDFRYNVYFRLACGVWYDTWRIENLSLLSSSIADATHVRRFLRLDVFCNLALAQKLQPLFTPALLATFACSISLGILKIGQMGQSGVAYREDD